MVNPTGATGTGTAPRPGNVRVDSNRPRPSYTSSWAAPFARRQHRGRPELSRRAAHDRGPVPFAAVYQLRHQRLDHEGIEAGLVAARRDCRRRDHSRSARQCHLQRDREQGGGSGGAALRADGPGSHSSEQLATGAERRDSSASRLQVDHGQQQPRAAVAYIDSDAGLGQRIFGAAAYSVALLDLRLPVTIGIAGCSRR